MPPPTSEPEQTETDRTELSEDLAGELAEHYRSAAAAIETAASLSDLDQAEAFAVGRESAVALARRQLGSIPHEERREAGRLINETVTQLGQAITERREILAAEEESRQLESDRVDVTLPGRRPPEGTLHIVRQVLDEIVDIFVSIGYTVATGPEAETEFYNFTALNMPDTHPARLETDTLYLDYGDDPEGVLLRTHTSPMQARYLETHAPPVQVVVPGRVFRRDPLDPTHSPVFHQVEGLSVAEDITFADLKGTLAHFAKEFLGPSTKVKFIPHHFPFTEPSAEMYAYANGRWLELVGCGMVNPAVFEQVGVDPERYSGFAFGMGADRMAMVRHGVTDLRHLIDPDTRVLRQYR